MLVTNGPRGHLTQFFTKLGYERLLPSNRVVAGKHQRPVRSETISSSFAYSSCERSSTMQLRQVYDGRGAHFQIRHSSLLPMELLGTVCGGKSTSKSQVDVNDVGSSGAKGYTASRAFAHSGLYTLVNAFMTQHMTTLPDGGVLEVDVADRANDEFLSACISRCYSRLNTR